MSRENSNQRIVSAEDGKYLDSKDLYTLEHAFRAYAKSSKRKDVILSRKIILLVFLLIRYTGAKLSEVLSLHPVEDIDWEKCFINFSLKNDISGKHRKVQVSKGLLDEVKKIINECEATHENLIFPDPGFVRKKFYERGKGCGLNKNLCGPEAIRKSRAIELLKSGVPLPAVQTILGHSNPGLTSSFVNYSKEEIAVIAKKFMEKESGRKTSARNSFFGKITHILKGSIQSKIDIITDENYKIQSVITNESLERMGLARGSLVSAEVKAPMVFVACSNSDFQTSADNAFRGTIKKISRGTISWELVITISDSTDICSIISSGQNFLSSLKKGDEVFIFFNCFSVILHMD
ncbi:MAG: TOBE domain-containing protein [Proteobacteria bacterium]|nr:TOBE domain-containing protein [Pseudomonadota bacterium]MBU1388358.1 TOBE domain-containing protein [Pseudomonadota bacterium]MBU1542818.1 TOBE domain-containing protein [Pseudomonadota bacterium]MBU2481850.1 TOBE domain-containing protein [Pseudomonadota bacterium]